jgi:tryptophan halogenase
VRIQARASGWQWRMPLQHHGSAGQVYSSAMQTDEAALQELTASAGAPLLEPLRAVIESGRRQKAWDRNVVALGSAAGFLEPLLGTDRHLVTHGLLTLLEHFPDRDFHASALAGYNAVVAAEIEHVRDFLILHYHLSQRDDPFWQERRAAPLPDSLAQRVELYRASGRIQMQRPETFTDLDWFWIFEGMGVIPRDYDPLVDCVDFEQVKRLMLALSQKISADVAAAPTHDSFFLAANSRLAGARKAQAAATPG